MNDRTKCVVDVLVCNALPVINVLSLSLSQDVLYTVCNPVGNVQRIVIFKRNGIQAMVEYPDCACVCACLCVCFKMSDR